MLTYEARLPDQSFDSRLGLALTDKDKYLYIVARSGHGLGARPMQNRTILLLPDESYGWPALRQCLASADGVDDVLVAASPDEAKELLSTHHIDSIIAALTVDGERLTPFFSDLRAGMSFGGTLYVFAQRVSEVEIAELARIMVDALLLWKDVPPNLLPSVCAVLASGAFHIASTGPSKAFLDQVRQEQIVGDIPEDLTQREQRLLKVWFHTDWGDAPPTRQQLAAALGVSPSTLQRDLQRLYAKLDAVDDLTLGTEATRRGLLP